MDRIADDLIHGVNALAEETGLTARSIYHQAAKGEIPFTRLGKTMIFSRSKVRRKLLGEE